MASIDYLRSKSFSIRKDLLRMIHLAGGGHVGGSLSSVDILVALYFHVLTYSVDEQLEERDRFILSKGHSVEGYYAVLAEAGFFPKEELDRYGSFRAMLFAHPTMKVPGVEVPSGALGHGLPVGVGMALAAKRSGRDYRVYVLMGDGEQAEGSVWEGAMSASHYGLGNLVGIIDYNKLQISGNVDDVMRLSSLTERWTSFGWKVVEIDGNDMKQIVQTFDALDRNSSQPTLILAHTTKGAGVSFMENQAGWHHKVPTDAQMEQALKELDAQLGEISI